MRGSGRTFLYAVFAATGASALTFQVTWQRLLTLHAGVDLSSITTIVAAFMVGLGLGNLVGGALADRLTLRGAVRTYAALEGGIALYALASVWLLHDLYTRWVPFLVHPAASFLVHTALVLVPTVFMGASLPILSRGVVRRAEEIAPAVGRLYAVNTLGAAAGALLCGWLLLGTLGIAGAIRLAAAVDFAAAIAVWLWSRGLSESVEPAAAVRADGASAAASREGDRRARFWIIAYGITGAAALGFEVVFFRLVDAVLRSNSYSFGHVLGLYLLVFGAGAAAGTRFLAKSSRPQSLFLALQLGVAISALASLVLLVSPPAVFGIPEALRKYFLTDGFAAGTYALRHARDVSKLFFAHLFAPLLVMGPAVFLMGAAFPCVQAVVSTDVAHLGRRTGKLLFANLLGNFVGSTVTGFWLLDRLGTAGTTVALALFLGVPMLVGWVIASRRKVLTATAGALSLGGLALASPSQQKLWSFLQGRAASEVKVVEDHACATVVGPHPEGRMLFINGASQSALPFDDFHLLIGLAPALAHPAPRRGLSIGYGMGASPFGISRDLRIGEVDNVELCGGEYALAAQLAAEGVAESRFLLESPRVHLRVGDGRRALVVRNETWDVITADALRPTSQASGNLHSLEFFELVRDRLTPNGLFAQWVPTDRTLQTLRAVFPHILLFRVPEYFNSQFMIASRAPIAWEGARIAARLPATPEAAGLSVIQHARLLAFLRDANPEVVQAGALHLAREERINRDLFPRDELFLNNPP